MEEKKMKSQQRTLTLLLVLLLALSTVLFTASCGKLIDGTYYLYKDGKTDTSSWVKIESGKRWSDSDGMSGSYTLEDDRIVFYVTFDGVEEELLSGTLSDNKLTVGALGINIVYYLDGFAPDCNNGEHNVYDTTKKTDESNAEMSEPENSSEAGFDELMIDFQNNFEYTTSGEKYIITGLKIKDITSVVIPHFVIEIADDVFKDCQKLQKVTFQEGIEKIGNDVFFSCDVLEEVILPKSLNYIGGYIFKNSESLTELHFNGTKDQWFAIQKDPENYTDDYEIICADGNISAVPVIYFLNEDGKSYYVHRFKDRSMTNVVVDATYSGLPVTKIGDNAFYWRGEKDYCKITNIVLPDSITEIGEYAFRNCLDLESITIPSGVTVINEGTFFDCQSLKYVNGCESITELADVAFQCCYSLESVSFPNVKNIGGGVFAQCSSLVSVQLPEEVESMGSGVFTLCTNLTTVSLPKGASAPSYTFDYCSNLTSITLPNDITELQPYFIHRCDNLIDIYFAGTKEEWNYLESNSHYTWRMNHGVYGLIIHCTDGDTY